MLILSLTSLIVQTTNGSKANKISPPHSKDFKYGRDSESSALLRSKYVHSSSKTLFHITSYIHISFRSRVNYIEAWYLYKRKKINFQSSGDDVLDNLTGLTSLNANFNLYKYSSKTFRLGHGLTKSNIHEVLTIDSFIPRCFTIFKYKNPKFFVFVQDLAQLIKIFFKDSFDLVLLQI